MTMNDADRDALDDVLMGALILIEVLYIILRR